MRVFFGLLPFLAVLLWTVAFYFRSHPTVRSWRWSLSLGCLVLGAFALLETELLSLLRWLSFGPVLTVWVLFVVTPLPLLCSTFHASDILETIRTIRTTLCKPPFWALLVLMGTLFLILLMAIATPPMNFDVQIYHLPRQVYWMMQGGVWNFAASHTHQISMPVLSEFLGLNLMILSGGDSWHNLLQFLFLIGALGLVTLAAKSLGSPPRGQILAALFVLLVPVVFFEASNAKNDLILSLYVLLPLLIGLWIWNRQKTVTIPLLLLASLGAGLALATKGTALPYLLPSALLIIVACVRNRSLAVLLRAALPVVLLAVLPALPQLARNWKTFGSLAGPNLHHSNLRHDPASIAGVAIRNVAGQFTGPSESWNHWLEQTTCQLLEHLGVSPNDPETTFEGQSFHLPYFAGLEDIVPAPVQTALLLLLPLGFLLPAFRKAPGAPALALTALAALFLFCLIFRWQPWQGRLLIPAYFMAAPLIGIAGDWCRPRWIPLLVTFLALLTLQPHLMFAGQRPLLGGTSIFRMSKTDQMSRMMPGRSTEIIALASDLKKKGAKVILIDGGATEIYGLLREIHQKLPSALLLSGRAEQPPSSADFVIATTTPDAGVPPPPLDLHPIAPMGFQPAWVGSYYRVFMRLGDH